MSPDRHVARRNSRIAMGWAFVAACALLGAVTMALHYLTRDEPAVRRDTGVRRDTADLAGLARERLTVPPAVSQNYVGSRTCRECHRDVWERYQTHPMAQSLGRVREVADVEDYAGASNFTRGGREYYVERSEAGVWHHERQTDLDGAAIYDQSVEVQYALGSGKRGRSYIIDRGGLLFMSPISWYSEKPRWDLAPGYPEHDHLRFERRVVDRCISCHAGRVAPAADWVDHFQAPAIVEFAIGCERCHGPGKEHVAWRRSAPSRESSPEHIDPIVNPSRLKAEWRESVCNQCHLHGDAEILRYGRTDFDFRPGMHVGEVWSFLMSHQDRNSQTPKAVSQVQQMYDSVCSQKSAGRLSCVSCHDPHFSPAEAEKPAFYREKCLGCHGVEDCRELPAVRNRPPAADSCVACHMPRLTASDVPHTSQTDHRIPRRPGSAPAITRPARAASNEFPEIFDTVSAPLSKLEESRVRGIITAKRAEETRNRRLAQHAMQYLEPVFGAAPDDREVGDNLAIVRFLGRRENSALELWNRLLDVPPVSEETLQSLVLACQKQGRVVEALGYLTRLVEINPWHARFWQQRSQLLTSLGRREEALASGLQALDLDPSLVDLYMPLAELARSLGKQDQANDLEQTGRRFKPSQ